MARNVHKLDTTVINLPTKQLQEDRGYKTCAEPYITFGNVEDASISWQNDLFSVAFIADTVEVVLVKDGAELTAFGIPLTFPYQPNAVGFMIVWREVLINHGAGCYKVKANYTLQGFEFTLHYGSFDLMPYSVEASEGTIRVLGQYNDLVKSYGINFQGSNFARSFRVKGNLHNEQPNTEHGNILKGNDKFKKYRNYGQTSYDLETANIPACQLDPLFEILIASNRLYVSDFNSANFRQYRDIEVVLNDDEEISFGEQFGDRRQVLAPLKQKDWLIESKYSGQEGEGQLFTSGLDFSSIVCPSGGGCDPATFSINNTQVATIPSGGSDSIEVRQEQGATEIGSLQGQYWRVDDSPITVDGASFDSLPATDSLDINLVDQDGNSITPLSLNAPEIEIDIPSGGAVPIGAKPLKTGCTVSVRTGDDGDLQEGRADTFFLLDSTKDPNPFGNYQRFTGDTGGYYDQDLSGYYDANGVATTKALAFPNGIMIDWSTYDGTEVLAYALDSLQVADLLTVRNAYDTATYGGYTGWRLWNMREVLNMAWWEYGGNNMSNWAPFNDFSLIIPGQYWTDIPFFSTINRAVDLDLMRPLTAGINLTRGGCAVKYMTVNGTTLT